MTLPAAQPFYFGPEERRLFGWLHRPASGTECGLGLIICNPVGYEEICAHRSLRHFAEAAAQAGIPTIRFDYDGIGDSAGSDLDPERVPAWIASVNRAADTLRELTGVQQLCFLGLRLGATLATLTANERPDVAALIVLAPVVSARAYIREMRALQSMMKRDENSQEPSDGLLETAGFILTPETQTSLSDIDLNKLEKAPAPSILIVDRPDIPGNERWAERLTILGAAVERQAFHGYTEMMLDSHETAVPRQTIENSIDWLASIAKESPGVLANSVPVPQSACMATIEESAVRFGPDSVLFGILSKPQASAANKQPRNAILLLNSGAVHRIGPNRLYVTLARHWAELGYTVLRMDLSGLGDSATRPGETENVVYSASASQDVRAALDYLRDKHEPIDCHAMGICSGAYHSFKAAVAGHPLRGVVLINPLTFFWKEGVPLKYPEFRVAADMQRYRTNMWRVGPWLKMLSGKVNVWELSQVLLRRVHSVAASRMRGLLSLIGVSLPEDLRKELKTLAKQKVDMTFVFAEQDPGLELLRTQGGATVSRLQSHKRLNIHIVPGANHTFTDRDARARLIEILTERFAGLEPRS